MQEAQCSAQSWVVTLPQVKQEKADAPEEWTAGTAFLTSPTLQSGCPSKVREVMGAHRWPVSEVIESCGGGAAGGDGAHSVELSSMSSRHLTCSAAQLPGD